MAAAVAGKLLLRRNYTADQLPRLLHTASPHWSMSADAPNSDFCIYLSLPQAAELRGQLQRKKEELYTLLNLVERGEHYDYEGLRLTWWDRLDRHRNLKLLQRLSVQIHPKPSDPEWQWHRGLHIFNFCMTSSLAGIGVADVYMHLGPNMKEEEGQDDDEEEFDSLAWMKQLYGEK
ncbi:unnamed protein product [Alopecurus aequalis]